MLLLNQSLQGCLAMGIATLTLFAAPAASARALGTRDGGVHFQQMNEAVLSELLANNGQHLKDALIQYLDTVSIGRIQNPAVQAKMTDSPGSGRLIKDILASPYLSSAPNSCGDEYDRRVAASTKIGIPASPVCFDIPRLAKELSGLSVEEGLIRMAAAALHEHVHHFQPLLQSQNKAQIQSIEAEANAVGAYVALTAKIQQIPVLEWEPKEALLTWQNDGLPTGIDSPVGCFRAGMSFAKSSDGGSNQAEEGTNLILCTSERGVVIEPVSDEYEDEVYRSGKFTIEIREARSGKVVARYLMNVRKHSGGGGIDHFVYALTKEIADSRDENRDKDCVSQEESVSYVDFTTFDDNMNPNDPVAKVSFGQTNWNLFAIRKSPKAPAKRNR